jgi:hypothetical protein
LFIKPYHDDEMSKGIRIERKETADAYDDDLEWEKMWGETSSGEEEMASRQNVKIKSFLLIKRTE